MTNRMDAVYIENEIDFSWSIEMCSIYDEN